MRFLRIFFVVLALAQVLPAWAQVPIFQAPSSADVGSNLVGQGVIGAFSADIFITNTGTARSQSAAQPQAASLPCFRSPESRRMSHNRSLQGKLTLFLYR